MSSRDVILSRIEAASPPATRPLLGKLERGYRGRGGAGSLDQFAARVADYQARVTRCTPSEVTRAVAGALALRRVRQVVAPAGLDPSWLPADVEVIGDDPPLDNEQLARVDAAVTTCGLAIAETGTIILDHGPGQGRRALTLIPDMHVVVVPDHLVVAGIPDAVAQLDRLRPQTWVSGPSATSDIELNRVEGVHGPRVLEVVLVSAATN